MLTAGIILSVMVIPFIASVMRDVFEIVPPVLKESAYGLGCDDVGSGVERRAAVHEGRRHRRHHAGAGPRARRDDGGDVRDRQRLPDQPRRCSSPGNSIASALANEFNEAADPVHRASLIALGLVLFVLTFIVLAASRYADRAARAAARARKT